MWCPSTRSTCRLVPGHVTMRVLPAGCELMNVELCDCASVESSGPQAPSSGPSETKEKVAAHGTASEKVADGLQLKEPAAPVAAAGKPEADAKAKEADPSDPS